MFDKQHYFISYIPTQTTSQYITIGSYNHISIADYKSVKFWAKLLTRILTVIFYNVIHVSSLRVNLVSLRVLYREDMSI